MEHVGFERKAQQLPVWGMEELPAVDAVMNESEVLSDTHRQTHYWNGNAESPGTRLFVQDLMCIKICRCPGLMHRELFSAIV